MYRVDGVGLGMDGRKEEGPGAGSDAMYSGTGVREAMRSCCLPTGPENPQPWQNASRERPLLS